MGPDRDRSSEADPGASPLLTDLYQFTMLAAYHATGMNESAGFEFFVRRLPEHRNFLVAAGLEQVLEYLEALHFTPADIDALAQTDRFTPGFLDWLATVRFGGDVDAVPEGTIVFPDEPLLRVIAPLPQAQLVETRVVNLLQLQTMVASKAARCVLAARGRLLVDFGLRRAHGAEAGLLAARAAWLAGFDGTATELAGTRFGIPTFGTMAHSFIQAHDSESEAFERFARVWPDNTTLLIDTYDTESGAAEVVRLAHRPQLDGISIGAVRLDSGDLDRLARRVRRILDEGGCTDIRIFVSGGLDEWAIDRLLRAGAPIDGFGVGTSLTTSADAPSLDCVYKLVEYAGTPRCKRSEGKETLPGRKQVYRRFDANGFAAGDVLTMDGPAGVADSGVSERASRAEALLVPVMRAGRRVAPLQTLHDSRERCRSALASLPPPQRSIDAAPRYPVEIGAALASLV